MDQGFPTEWKKTTKSRRTFKGRGANNCHSGRVATDHGEKKSPGCLNPNILYKVLESGSNNPYHYREKRVSIGSTLPVRVRKENGIFSQRELAEIMKELGAKKGGTGKTTAS